MEASQEARLNETRLKTPIAIGDSDAGPGGEPGTDDDREIPGAERPCVLEIVNPIGKFAFGDRTIPIHARTRGFDVSPQ